MEIPVVTIQEITGRAETGQPNVLLGAKVLDNKLNSIISALRRGSRVFLLSWQGSKFPRGAKILDRTISQAQNGVVQDERGHIIGTYDRLVEFGGATGKDQEMIVYTI